MRISDWSSDVCSSDLTRDLVPDGFNWPLGLAVDADGLIFVADGPFSYTLRPGARRELAGMLFTQGYPGYARGVAAAGPGEFVVATAMGVIARYWPAQQKSEVIISGLEDRKSTRLNSSH